MATRFLHEHGCRVVSDDQEDAGDHIPVAFEGATLRGNRWYVIFRRVMPPGVWRSRSEVEVWVDAGTGAAAFPDSGLRDPEPVVPMSEEEWLGCADPTRMLEFLRDKGSDRKFRLLACGCCRQHPALPHDTPLRDAIEAMEQLADGILTESTRPRYNTFDHHSLICCLGSVNGMDAACGTVGYLSDVPLVHLCRCVFGNPFRPATSDPSWLTSTVTALAGQMYESRDFSALPILADALQDAGCDNADVLGHCRPGGVHVRGCWVVDLILGKE